MLGVDHQPESGRQLWAALQRRARRGCRRWVWRSEPPKTPDWETGEPHPNNCKTDSRGRARNDGEGDKGTEIWIGDRVLV